jgi:hypothetical protein
MQTSTRRGLLSELLEARHPHPADPGMAYAYQELFWYLVSESSAKSPFQLAYSLTSLSPAAAYSRSKPVT